MEIGVGGSVSTQTANLNSPAVARENEAPNHVQRPSEEQTEPAAAKAAESQAPAAPAAAPANEDRAPVQAAPGPGKGSQLDVSA